MMPTGLAATVMHAPVKQDTCIYVHVSIVADIPSVPAIFMCKCISEMILLCYVNLGDVLCDVI